MKNVIIKIVLTIPALFLGIGQLCYIIIRPAVELWKDYDFTRNKSKEEVAN